MPNQEKLQKFEENIQNFDDLIKQNVRFVKGELDWAPYHDGPVIDDADEAETPGYEYNNVIKGLVKVNELGFVSIWGFGPLDDNSTEENKAGDIARKQYKSNFLGYVKRDKIKKFIEYLETIPEIKYQTYDYLNGNIQTNIPFEKEFHLEKNTFSKISDFTKRIFPDVEVSKPSYNYFIPKHFDDDYIEFTIGDFSDRVQNIIFGEAIFVHVALKDFCQDTHPVYCDIDFLYDNVADALVYANDKSLAFGGKKVNKEIIYLKQLAKLSL